MGILKKPIPIDRIKEVIAYNPESGVFTWKVATSKYDRTGQRAGTLKKEGYWVINLDNRDFISSRIAWLLMTGSIPDGKIIFKDSDSSNLKWENLSLIKALGGFDLSTKEGKSAYSKLYRKANYNEARGKDLKKTFGIDWHDYESMLLAQDGKCAICNQRETLTRKGSTVALAVDHDHETGKIRQLLCSACNQGLGQFKDNLEYLQNAVAYLTKHKAPKEQKSNVITLKYGVS